MYNGSSLSYLTVTTNQIGQESTTDTLYFGNGTVTYNGTVYYYVTNLQGDVVAIIDADGNTKVEYAYDAWGKILSISGPMADTLGAVNPLTYRGYVYDTETDLYYLQSRYYDPAVERFINGDALVSTGQGLLGNNMFAYCLNDPVNCFDDDGRDAVWIHETDSAGGFGHSGLLIQDDEGNWYFFYWGPTNENPGWEEIIEMATSGVPSKCVLVKVEVEDANLHEVAGVKEVMGNVVDATDDKNFVKDRQNKVSSIKYLEGDYSDTLAYLQILKQQSDKQEIKYHLLFNNCVQNTWEALSKSDCRFEDFGCPFIPDLANLMMELIT